MVDQDLQEVETEIEVEEEEIKCSVFDNDPLALRWRVFFVPRNFISGLANLNGKLFAGPTRNKFRGTFALCKHQS